MRELPAGRDGDFHKGRNRGKSLAMHNVTGNVSTFFSESVNIYRIPTAHQALGKVAAQNRHDPILKSSNLQPCAPDARDVRGRNKDFLTSTRKTGWIRTKRYLQEIQTSL